MRKRRVQRLSKYLQVDTSAFKKCGVLDPIMGVDINVFVDPQRLILTKIPEFSESRKKLEKHFSGLFRIIIKSAKYEDGCWLAARDQVAVKEISGVGIGFCSDNDTGNAIGKKLADQLLNTAQYIYKHGVEDPIAFELLGLFEKGFGPDRLSDLVIHVLRSDFLKYTERVTTALKIQDSKVFSFDFRGSQYKVPFRISPKGKKYPVTLLPLDILRDLPIALDPAAIEDAAHLKEELRDCWSAIINKAWEETREQPTKEDRRKMFLEHPEFFDPLIKVYVENTRPGYDFDSDPKRLIKWFEVAEKYITDHPVRLLRKIENLATLFSVVSRILVQFRKNIELNGLNKHLYDQLGDPLHEEYAQRLFYTVADGYCAANDLDVSPDSDAGKGPVDFKLSSGGSKVVVEMKLSKHSRILHGYEKQLKLYKESEGAILAHFVVIKVTKNESAQLKDLRKKYKQAKAEDANVPVLTVIDGLIYPSASKA